MQAARASPDYKPSRPAAGSRYGQPHDLARGEPMIEATHLTKRFGAKTAVDDLSFTVAPDVVTGLLGPNRAGKSTT
jgi:ABC-type molybdenum transport system ATPase subunit/photorepair protein PhrA